MAVQLSPFPKFEATDELGAPLSGGFLWTYEAGAGDTPLQATFSDSTGSIANPNPVVLDQAGRADVWLQENKLYKFVLQNASSSTIWTVDGVRGIGGGTQQELSQFLPPSVTPTFRDGTSFDLAGDQRGEFHIGRRVKLVDGGGTLLGSIQDSQFGGGITTVTVGLDSGTIDSGLQSVSLAFIRADEKSIDYAAIANPPVQADPFPVGFCTFQIHDAIPPKWIEMGTEVSKTTYSELYALYGDTFGPAGDPGNNFIAGHVAGRSPIGRGTADATGSPNWTIPAKGPTSGIGGEATHQQTEPELPAHNHGTDQFRAAADGFGTFVMRNPGTDQSTGSTGGGTPFNVTHPVFPVIWLVKALP